MAAFPVGVLADSMTMNPGNFWRVLIQDRTDDLHMNWLSVPGPRGAAMPQEIFEEQRLYHYKGRVLEPFERFVHDGDMFKAHLDLGFRVAIASFLIRPIGYNAPELHGASAEHGRAARAHLISLFQQAADASGEAGIVIQSLKDGKDRDRQSFNRYLCHVGLIAQDGIRDLADLMKEAGFDVPLASGFPVS